MKDDFPGEGEKEMNPNRLPSGEEKKNYRGKGK